MLNYFLKEIQNELHANHMELPVSMDVLTLCGEMDSFEIDYEKLKHLNNREFFEALFICLLKCFPEKENYAQWENDMKELDREAFQNKAIFAVANSMECMRNRTCIVNYQPLLEVGNVKERDPNSLLGVRVYERYHSLYMKMPVGVRKILKKALKKILIRNA